MGERGNAIPTTAFGYGTGTNRSFIKFAASNPPAANARVTSATLSLFQTTAYASSSTALVAYMAWNAWDSMTLTWGNQPTITSVGSATVNAFYNTQVNVDVTGAVYRWWQGGVTNNGFALQYADESQPCDFFASDDYGSNLPTLTVNYVADTTPPGQGSVGLTATGTTYRNPTTGTLYSNNPTVTLSPSYSNSSATTAWSSNWTSASGVGTGPSGTPAASFSVDAAGSQLTASTTPCGATACWVSTYFTATQNVANWPTFTAMFKTDSVPNFAFGTMSSGSLNNRLMVYSSSTSTTAFDHFQVTYASGSTYSTGTTSIPISANTWYYGQVAFLQTAVGVMGEIYIWAVGQPRPSVAQIHELFVGVPTPGGRRAGRHGGAGRSVGAILAPGQRMVSAARRAVGLSHLPTFQTYHRVLNRAVWSSLGASRILFGLLVATVAAEGPLVVDIDETIERRRGRKIAAAGIYRDPVRSSRGHFVKVRGRRWICATLLVPIPWAARVGALPFLTVLAPSERGATKRQRRRFKPLTAWARQMIGQIHRWAPTRR
jgi:hypothetical protein